MWGNRFSRINDSVNHNTDTTFLEFQGKEATYSDMLKILYERVHKQLSRDFEFHLPVWYEAKGTQPQLYFLSYKKPATPGNYTDQRKKNDAKFSLHFNTPKLLILHFCKTF